MSRSTTQPFPSLLQKFFTQRLLQQRHASPCTVAAYRDSFRLLLAFAHQRLHKRPSDITIEDLNAPFILEFLRHLEQDRHNSIRSRNARFAAIRSFMEYVSFEEPSAVALTRSVLAIPMKRFEQRIDSNGGNGIAIALTVSFLQPVNRFGLIAQADGNQG